MPEVILPCPACGSIDCECLFAEDEMYSVDCVDCSMRGPAERNPDPAIAAWNALPRALTWKNEPPKVAGWYWCKETVADRAHVFHFTGNWEDYGEHWESDRVCPLPLILNDNLWAGPIVPPIEP